MPDFEIPGFELIEKVGEGGMGQVWKARQLSLDRLVAIKLLPPKLSHDAESMHQIIKEARTAAKLKHPGIVHVYDACEQDGHCCLVMEYIDGYNVGQWLARKQVISSKDALVVIESVAIALKYAWREAGLIHCDLKPENIMIDHDGSIKVADLGLSRTPDFQVASPASDEVAGTPGYISPEQVQGDDQLDCRTDIYSLGCCLYQMVTGVRPFHNLTDSEAMEAHLTSQIPDPREIVPEVPASVCGLIELMLIKNRAHRIADWDAVLKELHRAQKSPLSSRELPPAGASTMRRRLQAAPTVPAPVPPDTMKVEKQPAAGRMTAILVVGLVLVAIKIGSMWWFSRNKPQVVTAPIPTLAVKIDTNVSAQVSHEVPGQPSHEAEIALAIKRLKRTANNYLVSGQLSEGIQWLENYSGGWAYETRHVRRELAESLKKQMMESGEAPKNQFVEQDDQEQVEADWTNRLYAITSCVLSGKYLVASQLVDAAVKEPKLKKHLVELTSMDRVLDDVVTLPDRLLATYEPDIGKPVSIPLVRGPFRGILMAIHDRKLMLKTQDESAAQVDLKLEEIAPAERQARLIALDLPEGNLVRGVAAYNGGKGDEADALWRNTGSVLGSMLIERVKADIAAATRAAALASGRAVEEAAMRADPAFIAFAKLAKKSGVDLDQYDLTKMRRAIESAPLNREIAMQLDRAMDGFLETYGATSFAEKHADLVLAFQSACGRAMRQ